MFTAQHSRIRRAGALRVIAGTVIVTGIAAATGVAGAATPTVPTTTAIPTTTPVPSAGTGSASASAGSPGGIVSGSEDVVLVPAFLGVMYVSMWVRALGLDGLSSCTGGLDTPYMCWPNAS